jgi:hypothetical protein
LKFVRCNEDSYQGLVSSEAAIPHKKGQTGMMSLLEAVTLGQYH